MSRRPPRRRPAASALRAVKTPSRSSEPPQPARHRDRTRPIVPSSVRSSVPSCSRARPSRRSCRPRSTSCIARSSNGSRRHRQRTDPVADAVGPPDGGTGDRDGRGADHRHVQPARGPRLDRSRPRHRRRQGGRRRAGRRRDCPPTPPRRRSPPAPPSAPSRTPATSSSPRRPEKGRKLMLTLAITAGVLALALVGVLILAFVTGVF